MSGMQARGDVETTPKVESSWHVARINYHDRDKDDLLLDGIRPLITMLDREHVCTAFLDRNWRGGPHIDLVVRVPRERFERTVFPLIADRVGSYLHGHPSRRALTDLDGRRIHDALSLYELLSNEYEPVRPDNTIEPAPYCRRERLLGGAEGVKYAEDYAIAIVPLIFGIISRSRGQPAERMAIAVRLLLAYARHVGGLERGYIFTRSYLEKTIAYSADPEQTRARFARAYEARRSALRPLVLETESDACDEDETVRQWEQVYESFAARATALFRSGLLRRLDDAELAELTQPYRKAWGFRTTPYLTAAFQNPVLREKLRSDVRYWTHFRMVNCLYALLAMVGITGAGKIAALSFVAHAVEEVYGISPVARAAGRV